MKYFRPEAFRLPEISIAEENLNIALEKLSRSITITAQTGTGKQTFATSAVNAISPRSQESDH